MNESPTAWIGWPVAISFPRLSGFDRHIFYRHRRGDGCLAERIGRISLAPNFTYIAPGRRSERRLVAKFDDEERTFVRLPASFSESLQAFPLPVAMQWW